MADIERKVLVAYFLADDGTQRSQTYVSNGKSVYPQSDLGADAPAQPPVKNVYRLVYYPLAGTNGKDPADPDSLLVLDVLPRISVVLFSPNQLDVIARIYSPLIDEPPLWETQLTLNHQAIDYTRINLTLNSCGIDLVHGASEGSDKLARFLLDHDRDQRGQIRKIQMLCHACVPSTDPTQTIEFSRVDGLPGYIDSGLKLDDLSEGLSLKLDEKDDESACGDAQHVLALFRRAAEIYNDDYQNDTEKFNRTYFVLAFQLTSKGGNKLRLFEKKPEEFADADLPTRWVLLHRPPQTIGDGADRIGGSNPRQYSILHIYGVPAKNVISMWNDQADVYHSALKRVAGPQGVSFLPRFGASQKPPASRWVMTYQVTVLTNSYHRGQDAFPDDFKNLASDGQVWFGIDPEAEKNGRVNFQPLSLHIYDNGKAPALPVAVFSGVRDVSGNQLNLPLNPIRTVQPRGQNAEIDWLAQAEQVHGIAISLGSALTLAGGAAQTVRMGSLDLAFGGDNTNWPGSNWLVVQKNSEATSRVHIDTFFSIADVQPGGQDDPAGDDYVPENSSFDTNACLAPYFERKDPLRQKASVAAEVDRQVEAGFRRLRPVVIHVGDAPPKTGLYALRVKEDAAPLQVRAIRLDLYSQNQGDTQNKQDDMCSRNDLRRAYVLDPSPFLVAEVRYPAFEGVSSDQSSIIATWNNTNPGQGAAWMLQFEQQPFCMVLPPQGLGEEMIKSFPSGADPNHPEDPPTNALPFRLSPPAKLTIDPRSQQTSFAEAPWNLRRILGTPQDPLPGPMVNKLQYELLYGLTCSIDYPAFRLAELTARVGQIPGRRDPKMLWQGTSDQNSYYDKARKDWAGVYRRYMARVAVLQPWNGLINSPTSTVALKDGLGCSIRLSTSPTDKTGADMANPVTLQDSLGATGPSLRGGATWGYESKNIYDAVVQNPNSTSATLENFSFSALGGWGRQYASFLQGGSSRIYADVEMGRTSEYKLEQIGRIAIWYTLAKHVIIYRRSVTPSRQFYTKQPNYFGWPVLRKVEEYVEILEDARPYPDNTTSASIDQQQAAKQARGPIGSILLKKGMRFNVDGSWGADVGDGANWAGWKIPLWSPSAWPPDVYPKPSVGVGAFVSDSSSGAGQPPVIDNPENLTFFTLTALLKNGTLSNVNVDADPHSWAAVRGIDFVNAPPPVPPADFANADLRQTVPSPLRVPALYGPCTFTLVPGPVPVNLVADRATKAMSAMLESITVVRATAAAAPSALTGVAADITAIQDKVNAVAGGLLRALPLNGDPTAMVGPAVFADLKAKTTALFGDLKTQIITAQGHLSSLVTSAQNAAKKFEGDVANKFKNDLTSAVSDFKKYYAQGVTQLIAAFDASAAAQFLQSQKRQFEETLLFPASTPGTLTALVAKYSDAVIAIKHTVDNAITTFQASLAQWNAGNAAIIRDLQNDLEQAIAIGDGLKTLRPPVESFPNPYNWAESKLGPILTGLDAARQNFIQDLQAAGADPQTALNRFKATAFYLAIKDDYPASIFTLVEDAVGPLPARTADEVRKALHPYQEWAQAELSAWDQLCDGITIRTAEDLTRSITTLGNRLDTIVGDANTVVSRVTAQAQSVINVFQSEYNAASQALTTAMGDLQSLINPAQKTLQQLQSDLEQKRDELARQAEQYLDKAIVQGGLSGTFQTADGAFRLIRAFGAPPQVPNLSFGRDKIEYFFQEVEKKVNLTPVLSRVAQAGELFDSLKTLGATVPTIRMLDQLIPTPLKGFNLSDIFRNFAGLTLNNLFPGLTLPDLSNDAVKITHDIDPQTMRAVLRADVNFGLTDSSTLFTIGPVSVQIVKATFQATTTVSAGTYGIQRTTSGTIHGDWQMVLSGTPLVKLKDTQLHFDDSGGLRFAINPKNVELPGVLQLVSDLLNAVVGKDSGLSIGLLKDGFQSILNLPVPDIQGVTSGFSNLRLGAVFAIEFADNFTMTAGFTLASKEAPFSLTIFVLGGGGFLDVRAKYTPGGNLVCTVNLAMTASASLAISLAVISGGVYVYFGATASFSTGAQGLTFGVEFLVRGEVSVLGIVSAAISLLLEATYGGGTLTGHGQLSISIKICWCFTLEVNEGITYTLGSSSDQPRMSWVPHRTAGPMLAAAADGPIETWTEQQREAVAAGTSDIFDQYAQEYISMLV